MLRTLPSIRRLALVGPAPPDPGGIAHVTARLRGALSQEIEVRTLTFSRTYPRLLRRRPPAQAVEAASPDDTARILDALSPSSWLRAGAQLAAWSPDAVLLAHWQPLLVPSHLGMLRALRRGTPAPPHVSVLLHTVRPHEPLPGWRALVARLLGACDSAVTLSAAVAREAHALRPQLPTLAAWHPLADPPDPLRSPREARQVLGLPDRPTLLFFGHVRGYKGLDLLLDALPAVWRERPDLQLVAAGEVVAGQRRLARRLDRLASQPHARVVWWPGYVPDERMRLLFDAADGVVLPYRRGVQSGVLETALAHGRPVVATRVGAFPDEIRDGVQGALVRPEDPDALARGVLRLLDANLAGFADAMAARRRERATPALARRIETFLAEQAAA